MPQVETLLSYKPKDATSYKAEVDDSKRVIIGVHPYDIAGIGILDRAFLDDKADANYQARRDNTTVIGVYPLKEFEYRFAATADNADPSETADAMLCDLGDSFGVEIFTDKGKDFFGGAAADDADAEAAIAEKKNAVADGQKLPVATSEIPALLSAKYESEVWADKGEKCYSCGSCVLVCPTCYCFDVREELELSLERGERVRVWDGCMLEDFAKVAGDHNFRQKQGERFAHRIMRKGKYLVEKFDSFGCVGCGRCAKACTADIANPVEILEDLKKES
jgi:NAD-dependent dihydropyrimidine dehydrogenase PreA subunit